MKKRDLFLTMGYILLGAAFLAAAMLTETKVDAMLCGLAGGFLGSGLMRLWQYCYWSKPERREEYASRQETKRISRADERNQMIRDRARGYAFLVGVQAISFSMLGFCILGLLDVPILWNVVVLYLGALLVLEFVTYTVAFYKLQKKY